MKGEGKGITDMIVPYLHQDSMRDEAQVIADEDLLGPYLHKDSMKDEAKVKTDEGDRAPPAPGQQEGGGHGEVQVTRKRECFRKTRRRRGALPDAGEGQKKEIAFAKTEKAAAAEHEGDQAGKGLQKSKGPNKSQRGKLRG